MSGANAYVEPIGESLVSRLVIVIVVVVVVVLALLLVLAAVRRSRRRSALIRRFGPEYDRTADRSSRRKADTELQARADRREQLDIRPLSPTSVERYRNEWRLVQERFVDAPAESVGMAQTMLTSALSDRGYPTTDQDERMSMLSVDHADVVDDYRKGAATEQKWRASGSTDTEELRQAMQHYRAVFTRVVGETGMTKRPKVAASTIGITGRGERPAAPPRD
jgi:hypothetical protein